MNFIYEVFVLSRQVVVPVAYKGVNLDCGYKLDLLIENTVILELKCVERITSTMKRNCLPT